MINDGADTSVDHPFKQLEWDAQQWNVPVAHGSVLGLVRLREGDGSWLAPDFGILHLSKEVDINWHSHLVAAFPSCNRNSGWISSGRGVLLAFIDLSASTSSSVVNGVDMFTSLLSTFNSSATPLPTRPEKPRPGLAKRPSQSSRDATASAPTGHPSGPDAVLPARRLSRPSFSAGACEVKGFHCLHPTFLAFLGAWSRC